jgi:hypothetical protein
MAVLAGDALLTHAFVLLARVRALLRRHEGHAGEPDEARRRLVFGPLVIDSAMREAWLGEQGIELTSAEFDLLSDDRISRSIQIDDDLFMAGHVEAEIADWVNHSCTPNCGMSGQVIVVAMRDIAVGEELTYDYAMSDGSDYDEFECACGTAACRGKVTGNDWMLPELQLAYRGYFSPYLARRIAALVPAGAARRAFAL